MGGLTAPKPKRAQRPVELFADSFFEGRSWITLPRPGATSCATGARFLGLAGASGHPLSYPGGGLESATKRRQSRRIAEAVRAIQRKRREIVFTASSQFAAFNP